MNIPIIIPGDGLATPGFRLSRTHLTLAQEGSTGFIFIPTHLLSGNHTDEHVLIATGLIGEIHYDAIAASGEIIVVSSISELPASAQNGDVVLITGGSDFVPSTISMDISIWVDDHWGINKTLSWDNTESIPLEASEQDSGGGGGGSAIPTAPLFIPNGNATLMYVKHEAETIPLGSLACGEGMPFGRNTIGLIIDAEHEVNRHILLSDNTRGYLSEPTTDDIIQELFAGRESGCGLVLLEAESKTVMENKVDIRNSAGLVSDVVFLVSIGSGEHELVYFRHLSGSLRELVTLGLTEPAMLGGSSMGLNYIRPLSIGPCSQQPGTPCEVTLEAATSGGTYTAVSESPYREDIAVSYVVEKGTIGLIGFNSVPVSTLTTSSIQGVLVEVIFNDTTRRITIYRTGADTVILDPVSMDMGDRISINYLNNVMSVTVAGVAIWGIIDPLGGGEIRSDSHAAIYTHFLLGVEADGHVYRNVRLNGMPYTEWEDDNQVTTIKKNCGAVLQTVEGRFSIGRKGPLSCTTGDLGYTSAVVHPNTGQKMPILWLSPSALRGYADIMISNSGTATTHISLFAGLSNSPIKADTILANYPLAVDGTIDLPNIPLGSGEKLTITSTRSNTHVLGSLLEEFSATLQQT